MASEMKVIKLNRRYKMFKERGHTIGLKFDTWYKEADVFEAYLRKIYGMDWNNVSWHGYYGTRPTTTNSRPYFITIRDEKMLTAMLLAVQ